MDNLNWIKTQTAGLEDKKEVRYSIKITELLSTKLEENEWHHQLLGLGLTLHQDSLTFVAAQRIQPFQFISDRLGTR